MNNFDLKKFLVENKLTVNSRLNEEDKDDYDWEQDNIEPDDYEQEASQWDYMDMSEDMMSAFDRMEGLVYTQDLKNFVESAYRIIKTLAAEDFGPDDVDKFLKYVLRNLGPYLQQVKGGKYNEGVTEDVKDVKVGDKIKHRLTGAEMVVTKVSKHELTTKLTSIGKLPASKVGDINKFSPLSIGKTYDLLESKNIKPADELSPEEDEMWREYSAYEENNRKTPAYAGGGESFIVGTNPDMIDVAKLKKAYDSIPKKKE